MMSNGRLSQPLVYEAVRPWPSCGAWCHDCMVSPNSRYYPGQLFLFSGEMEVESVGAMVVKRPIHKTHWLWRFQILLIPKIFVWRERKTVTLYSFRADFLPVTPKEAVALLRGWKSRRLRKEAREFLAALAEEA